MWLIPPSTQEFLVQGHLELGAFIVLILFISPYQKLAFYNICSTSTKLQPLSEKLCLADSLLFIIGQETEII